MRIAPKGGYDFARKRDYRRKVWATFRDTLKSRKIPVAEAHALLMPSLEGDEIEVALAAGFRERNLHIVDDEPAIVATLRRRYPKVNTYGVKASRALQRIAKSGVRIQCANLDFCGKASLDFLSELVNCSLHGHLRANFDVLPGSARHEREYKYNLYLSGESGAFDEETILAVSILRGREEKWMTSTWAKNPILDSDLARIESKLSGMASRKDVLDTPLRYLDYLRSLSDYDRQRVSFVSRALNLDYALMVDSRLKPGVDFIRGESYKSSNGQTMLWTIWAIHSAASSFAESIVADMIRLAGGFEVFDEHHRRVGPTKYQEVFGGGYDHVAKHIYFRAFQKMDTLIQRNKHRLGLLPPDELRARVLEQSGFAVARP